MKEFFRIRVFQTKDSQKPVLERLVCSDDGLQIPFSSLMQSFRWLYGSKCIVRIDCEGYENK